MGDKYVFRVMCAATVYVCICPILQVDTYLCICTLTAKFFVYISNHLHPSIYYNFTCFPSCRAQIGQGSGLIPPDVLS